MRKAFRLFCFLVAFWATAAYAEETQKERVGLAFGQNPSIICNMQRQLGELPSFMTEGRGVRGQIRACELAFLKENNLTENGARRLRAGTVLVFVVKTRTVHAPQVADSKTTLAQIDVHMTSMEREVSDLQEKVATLQNEGDNLFWAGVDLVVKNEILGDNLKRTQEELLSTKEVVRNQEKALREAERRPTWETIGLLCLTAVIVTILVASWLMSSDDMSHLLRKEENLTTAPLQAAISVEEVRLSRDDLEGRCVDLQSEVGALTQRNLELQESLQKLQRERVQEEAPQRDLLGWRALVDVSSTGIVPEGTPPMLVDTFVRCPGCERIVSVREFSSNTTSDPFAHLAKCPKGRTVLAEHAKDNPPCGSDSHPASAEYGTVSLGRAILPKKEKSS